MIYDWLRRSGEIGKFGRSQEEIAAKSPVKNPERFKRALRYLSKKGLVINNHGSYMLTREKMDADFPKPQEPVTTVEQVYARPLIEN